MISRNTIEKVIDASSICDVVSDYVSLKRRGKGFVACCPFHQEKTPSFYFYPQTDTFKCFGCGEGGNAVSFLMKHEGLTFPEAIKLLAGKYGIDVEESIPSEEEQKEYLERDSMRIALDLMAKEYQRQLHSHKNAMEYAYGRWGKNYCELMGIG